MRSGQLPSIAGAAAHLWSCRYRLFAGPSGRVSLRTQPFCNSAGSQRLGPSAVSITADLPRCECLTVRWVGPVWQALLQQGAKPVGLREWRWVAVDQVDLAADVLRSPISNASSLPQLQQPLQSSWW